MTTSAVVLHYELGAGIGSAMRSLDLQEPGPRMVYLVDNASSPESLAAARAMSPGSIVVQMASNVGYAAAVNAAVARASEDGDDRVLIMTHDAVLAPGVLGLLQEVLDQVPTAAVAAPLLFRGDEPEVVWSRGGSFDGRSGRVRHLDPGEVASPTTPASLGEQVDWADGAVLLVRVKAWQAVAGFHEGYFLYCEEVDFALSLLRDIGMHVRLRSDAVAWQVPGMAPPYLDARNRIILARRHGSKVAPARQTARELARLVRALCTRERRWGAGLRWRGIVHGWTGDLDRTALRRRG